MQTFARQLGHLHISGVFQPMMWLRFEYTLRRYTKFKRLYLDSAQSIYMLKLNPRFRLPQFERLNSISRNHRSMFHESMAHGTPRWWNPMAAETLCPATGGTPSLVKPIAGEAPAWWNRWLVEPPAGGTAGW